MGTPLTMTDEEYRKHRAKYPSVENMLRSLVIDDKEDLAVEVAAHAVENGEIGIFDLPYDRMEQEIFKTLSQRPKLSKRLTDDLIGGKSSISLMGFSPTPEDHKRLLQHIVQNKPEWVHSYISSHKAPWTHQDLLDIDDLTLKGKAGQNPVFENLLKKLPHDVANRYFEEVLKEPLTSMWEGQPHPSGLHSFLFSLHPEVLPERAASLLIREAIKRGEDKRMILTSGRRDDGHGLVDVLDDETRELLKRRFSEGHYKTQGFENELAASRFLSALESRSPLQRAAEFWHDYELDVEPHHFAVGKSLHTNQPETLTDHRGRTGTSEPYMSLLPKLRQYAQSVQQGLRERIEAGEGIGGHRASGIRSKKVNGKIYIKVYRGVAGDYAKEILDKVRLNDTDENGVVSPVYSTWNGTHILKDSTIKIPASSISSWSLAPHIAKNFANRNISSQADDGFIMSAYLPLESVIHDGFNDQFPNQPHAHRREQELIFHHVGDDQFHRIKTKNLQVRDEVGEYCPATVHKAPKKPKMAKSEYDPKELELGIQVEMEHTKDKKKAQEIAEEHLAETPDYYSKMKECGLVKVESKLVPESGPSKQLTVLHNLTQDNLLHAHELGGLPAPSLAVANINHPLSSFGEVTLVGHPDLVDPKKGAPTFDADIYSPRWPNVKHKVDLKAHKEFMKWLQPHADRAGGGLYGVDETLEDKGPAGVIDSGTSTFNALTLAYLNEKGHDVPVPMMPVRLRTQYSHTPEMERFWKEHGVNHNFDHGGYYHQKISEAYRAGLESAIRKQVDALGWDEDDFKTMLDAELANKFDERTGKLQFNKVFDVLHDANKAGQAKVDTYGLNSDLQKKLLEVDGGDDKLRKWAHDKLKPLVSGTYIAKRGSTGRVTKKPYNLDNILYELTRTIRQGESFNYGLGSARAAGAKKFKSLEEIRANADRIVPSEEFEQHKDANGKLFDEITNLLNPYSNYAGHGIHSNIVNAISDSYKRNGHRALELNGFRNVPPDVRRKFHEFAEKLVGSPTEYFESKPQRVVHLNEFHGAVVPHDVKPEVIEALKSHGIHNIETYDRSDEASRARALRNIVEHKNLYLSESTFDDLKKAIEHALDSDYPPKADTTAHLSNVEFHANPDQIDEYEDMQNGPEDKHFLLGGSAKMGGCTEKAGYQHNETGNRYLVKPYHGGFGSGGDGWGEQTITDMYKSANIPHLIQKSHVTNGVNEKGEGMPLLVIHMEPHVVSANDMCGKLSDADKHRMALDALKIQAIDFLTGNTDRHGNNLMFKLDRHTGKPVSPFAIDNSMWNYSDFMKVPFRSSGFRLLKMTGDDLPAHFDDLGKWWQNYSPFIRNALQKNIPHLTQEQDYITSNFDKRCKELDDMFDSLKRNPIGAP